MGDLVNGDRAAEAVGHGKWQYVREDGVIALVDSFFATRIFWPDRLAHFREQGSTLARELATRNGEERERISRQLTDVDQRIGRQLAAIEAGDPAVVGERIRVLKAEREDAAAALAQLEAAHRDNGTVDPDDALAVLGSLPDLGKRLATAEPEIRRAVFDAFRLRVEIDRNAGQVRLKAFVSSAFSEASDLTNLGDPGDPALSDKAIPLPRKSPASSAAEWSISGGTASPALLGP